MQNLSLFKSSYLIIGGPHTNKSEVARILSKELGYKLINLDREKYAYFNDFTDIDLDKYFDIVDKYGSIKALSYIHKYEMKHLNYVLDNIDTNVVIDFGNTYLIIDDDIILNKLKMYENIVYLYKEEYGYSDELEKKLYRNKILDSISTIKINIDNKSNDEIIKLIKNDKKYKDIL